MLDPMEDRKTDRTGIEPEQSLHDDFQICFLATEDSRARSTSGPLIQPIVQSWIVRSIVFSFLWSCVHFILPWCKAADPDQCPVPFWSFVPSMSGPPSDPYYPAPCLLLCPVLSLVQSVQPCRVRFPILYRTQCPSPCPVHVRSTASSDPLSSGAKHICKSKCTKHLRSGPILEVEMSKKVDAVVARSTLPSQNVEGTFGS